MPDFPPLFEGRAVTTDPFVAAVAAARQDADPGLILHRASDRLLEAALVLAPEVPLEDAAAMVLVAGNGLADALVALGPPELGLHLGWPYDLRINGARCGRLLAAAPRGPAEQVPAWLVVGMVLPLAATDDREPGEHPDETDLGAEGVDLASDDLLAAWARHSLGWITRWEDEGVAPVNRHWSARAWGVGDPVTIDTAAGPRNGRFQGLDERGGILLKGPSGTTCVPLTDMLDRSC